VVLVELAGHRRQCTHDVLRHGWLLGNDQCLLAHTIPVPHARTRTHAYIFKLTGFLAMAEKAVNGGADALVTESGARASGRRIQVRRSGVHGKGVFALRDIAEGEVIIEYVGEIISWKEADRRHPTNPEDPNHTFYFSIGDGKKVIDAA